MNKIFTITISLLLSISTFAQFEIIKEGGEKVTDGQTIIYKKVGEQLKVSVKNTSAETKNFQLKIEVKNGGGITGSDAELCALGSCLPPNKKLDGIKFPKNGQPLKPNQNDESCEIHLTNKDNAPLNNADYIDYILSVYLVDDEGNKIEGDGGKTITFTYRYQAKETTSISENNIVDNYIVYPTVTNGNVTIKAEQDVDIKIFSIIGNLAYKGKVIKGNNILNLDNLKEGVYFVVMFDNQNNIVYRGRIVKS